MDAVGPARSSRRLLATSIGKWIDEDGDDGDDRYDVLEVETRGPFKSPRAYDAGGLPLHFHNQTTFGERLLFPQRGRLAYANA
jgi:hypothetical protein